MDISKKVFGSNVSETIQEYINNLQKGNSGLQPGESVTFDTEALSYLGNRTPYARMWTAISRAKVEWGEDPEDSTKNKWNEVEEPAFFVYSINENRDKSYEELEPVDLGDNEIDYQYVKESLKDEFGPTNAYLKPLAGIKSINSKSEGSLGALRRTTVEFVVHNKNDFETIYLPFFLKPGANVFIDFGWSDKAFSLYNPEGKLHALQDKTLKRFYEEVVNKPEDSIEGGFQTTIVGNVIKYDVNVDSQGSFNCTLEVVSGNYRLLDQSVSDDNDLKYIFNNTIEEIILGYYAVRTGKNPASHDFFDYTRTNVTTDQRNQLVRDALDNATTPPEKPGIITTTAKETGVFYQDIDDNQDKRTDKEAIYISFGVFEDFFLNKFISQWEMFDDDGNPFQIDKADEPFTPVFSSINTYVRYDTDLYTMQQEEYLKEDSLISFLFPDIWDNTYNTKKPLGVFDKETNPNGWVSTVEDKAKARIPLRDLFISVPTISEAFASSDNVNDALEFIFNKIYEDSGNIINIKLITPNDAQTALTFVDVNVVNLNAETTLQFDITSGNTIVQNFDLKMETPKAGLASMIAIGGLSSPTVFDEMELMKFNALNAISSEGKYQVKHLPHFGDISPKKKAITLKLDEILKSAQNLSKIDSDSSFNYEEYKKNRLDLYKKNKKKNDSSSDGSSTNEEKDLPTETNDGKTILYASSERDYYLLNAKVKNFILTSENSISPVLPITLSLKVYGNNFLSFGDFFTVNYLPEHYEKKVVFQIVGVDHTIDTNGWSTNYTTVMRLKSTQKYRQFGDTAESEIPVDIKYHSKLTEIKLNDLEISQGIATNPAIHLMATDLKAGETLDIGLSDDIKVNLEKNEENLYIEWTNLKIKEETLTLNPKEALQQIKDLKEELEDDIANVLPDSTRFPMAVNLPEKLEVGNTMYWLGVSELILGNQLIDWKSVNQDYPLGTSKKPVALHPIDGTKTNKTIKQSVHNTIGVYPVQIKDGSSITYNSMFRDLVLERYDDIVWELGENLLGSDLMDTVQYNIYQNVYAGYPDDNIPLSAQSPQHFDTQFLSEHLKYKFSSNDTKYILKPGENNGKTKNRHLFHSIFWDIPQEGDSEWTILKITGDDDANVLNHIIFPKKYKNKESDFKVVFNSFWKQYSKRKTYFSKFFADPNTWEK